MNDAKSFLQQVELCDKHINSKLEQVAQLRELATKITATWKQDIVSGGSDQDKIGNAVAKIIDLEEEINTAVDEFVDKKRKVSCVIDQIGNADYIAVLYKRYFEYKTWERIACEMNFTYQWVCKLHGRALQVVDGIIKNQKS